MNITKIAAVACITIVIGACHKRGTDSLNNADRVFLERVAYAEHVAAEMSGLALYNVTAAPARYFSQLDITDHPPMFTDLKTLADKKNYKLPGKMDLEHQVSVPKIGEKSGREFDSLYMRAQVMDHEMTMNIFEEEIKSGSDGDVKAYATRHFSTIKAHFKIADSIAVEMHVW